MKRQWIPTLTYSFAHFAVDLGCAFAMFSACSPSPICFLLYNFCAFAMQMPLGLLSDVWGRNRSTALLGIGLVFLICLFPSIRCTGAVLLGLGNGLFHVGGGLDVMNVSGKKAAPLGVFVSPGAYGIYLGTILGKAGKSPLPVLGILILACCGILLLSDPCHLQHNAPLKLPNRSLTSGAALLFLVVILRSYGGMAATFPWKTGFGSFAAVSAVVLGKTLGGFLSDRFGLMRSSVFSLGLCSVLFFFSDSAVPGILAIFLFNMTMPITLYVLAQSMPGVKGFSFGLLTFALFLGFLPSYFGAPDISGSVMAIVAAASALFLLPGIRICSARRKEML